MAVQCLLMGWHTAAGEQQQQRSSVGLCGTLWGSLGLSRALWGSLGLTTQQHSLQHLLSSTGSAQHQGTTAAFPQELAACSLQGSHINSGKIQLLTRK